MKLNHITLLTASLMAGTVCLTSCDDEKVYDLNHPEASLISTMTFDYEGELTLPIGMEMPINITITPAEAASTGIIYKSTDESVAYIGEDNKLHCVGEGTCNVTAVPSIGFGATAKLTVKVASSVNYAQAITLSPTETLPEYIYTDDTFTLKAVYTPADHTYDYLTWSTSDAEILSVDENGNVTCGKPGTATITAETRFPDADGVKGEITLTVSDPVDVERVTITPITEAICVSNPFDLDVTYFPAYGTKGSVVWSSSDETVAVVTRGHVTPVGFGTCTITAKCPAFDYETSVEINVTPGWYIWDSRNNFGPWYAGDNAEFSYEGNLLRVKMSEMSAGGQWRGDLRLIFDSSKNSSVRFHFGEYPVIALRTTIPADGRNTIDAVDINGVNANNPQCNEGRYNTGNPITLADGTKLIYIDMAARTSYSKTDYTDFWLLQLKVADIPAENVAADKKYSVYWIRTFRSVEEMKAFAEAEVAAGN